MSILIIDDTPANLGLLSNLLRSRGYRVRPVPSGELGLRAARLAPPELVLLDINMPGMDGYQVCEQLKRDPRLSDVPVIFVSAFDDIPDKVRGFKLGAVDYVTKPFQFEEVEARVHTHLELSRLRRQLAEHVRQLEDRVLERTRELAASTARLTILDQAKSDFLTLICHELRTPLQGVLGITELLLAHCKEPAAAQYAEWYAQSRLRLMRFIEDALLLSQIGARAAGTDPQPCELLALLERARAHAEPFAASRQVVLGEPMTDARPARVRGSAEYLVRALQALLETAVKFALPETTVALSVTTTPEATRLAIEASGRVIEPDALPRFFDLLALGRTLTPGGDLGLSPALAERIISLYGGRVSVENLSPKGIRLVAHLAAPEGASTLNSSPAGA